MIDFFSSNSKVKDFMMEKYEIKSGKFLGMKRLSDNNGIFLMTAVDQRPPSKNQLQII